MRQCFAFLLFLGFSTWGLCQSDMSFLIEAWNDTTRSAEDRLQTAKDLHLEFHQKYPDTVLFYLAEMRDLAIRADRPLALYSAHNRMASLLEKQGHTEEALTVFGHAEQVAISLGDSARLGTVYGNRGNVYVQLNQYVEALRHYNRAIALHEGAGRERSARKMRMALGNVFMIIGHNGLAMAQFEMVQEGIANQPDMGYFPGLLALNMGWCAFELNDHDRAAALYASALQTLEREQKGFYVAGCHENMATLSEEVGSPDDAMEHWVMAMEMYRDLGARGDELSCMLGMAQLTLPSDPGKALRVASDNQKELLGQTGYEIKRQLYSVMYLAHKALGHDALALQMHESFVLYDDSLQSEKHRLAVIRAAYEKDVEHQLLVVQWENEQKHSLQKVQQLKTSLALVLGFISVIGLLMIYIVNIKRRHNDRRDELMCEIAELHRNSGHTLVLETPVLELNRTLLEKAIGRTLNDTDWNVLNILLEDPAMTNRNIADKAHLSIDGIGSSLRRMYGYFEIMETKYKKMALLHAAMKVSSGQG
jgi:tetratricopeptide (TPR) repeat protein